MCKVRVNKPVNNTPFPSCLKFQDTVKLFVAVFGFLFLMENIIYELTETDRVEGKKCQKRRKKEYVILKREDIIGFVSVLLRKDEKELLWELGVHRKRKSRGSKFSEGLLGYKCVNRLLLVYFLF